MSSMSNSVGLKGPLAVLSVIVVLYSLIIAQQVLLGIMTVATLWFVYLLYRLILRLGRIATVLERLAEHQIDDRDGWDGRE